MTSAIFAVCQELRGLAPRVQAFAVAYARTGDPEGAALAAGYKPLSARSMSTLLLRRPEVRTAALAISALTASISTDELKRRRRWWTAIMRGQVPLFSCKDRIHASELLHDTLVEAEEAESPLVRHGGLH